MTKEQFLENLENALKRIVCNLLDDDGTSQSRTALEREAVEFVRNNAAEYTLEELMETFTSAEATIGLFLEYRDAKRICGDAADYRPI